MSENVVNEKAIVPAEKSEAVEANSLIVVKQLPIIEEQLKTIKADIEHKVSGVLALECTEGTVKAIKVLRADLNKDFRDLEERRKFVKSKILEPYENFDAVYKECVTEIFKGADTELKKRIDEVENNLKFEKRKEVEDYFNEYAASKNIDFVGFFDAHINVTMSVSKKSLQEQVKAFIDRICDDLTLIDTQEHKEEILVEYKNTLNASASITTVVARHKAIDEVRAEAERREQFEQEQQEAVDKVNNAVKTKDAPLSAPKTAEADPIIIMKIGNTRIKAKKSDCVILKNLLSNGKYEIL